MAAHDVMRRYLEAVQRGDWETGFGFFPDDIVLHVLGCSSLAGEHRGRPAAEGYLHAALARAHGSEVDELFADGPSDS
jgi:ketosteroid isomerase-like protein